MSETYEIYVMCRNCWHKPVVGDRYTDPNTLKKLSIPKGTEVKKFLREMTCENCGCDGFMGIL